MKSEFLKLYNLILEDLKNNIDILALTKQLCNLIEKDSSSDIKQYIVSKKENLNSKRCQIIYQLTNDINRNDFMDKLYDICINSNLIDKSEVVKDEYPGHPIGFSFINSTGCKKVVLSNVIGFVAKGGLGARKNSTLNSNLTELIPCLLFYNDSLAFHSIDSDFIEELKKIVQESNGRIFLDDKDQRSALKTLSAINLSEPSHLIKIKSGIKLYKYIKNHMLNETFLNIWWCYRKKPGNVSPSNPSDIIIEVVTDSPKKYIGYSLKSGTYTNKPTETEKEDWKETSFEPKLNSYVVTILSNKIADKSLLNEFTKQLNEMFVKVFSKEGFKNYNLSEYNLPVFTLTDITTFNDWEKYKKTNVTELRKIKIGNKGYREIQQFIINFFRTNFNTDIFKTFFINQCLRYYV